MEVRHKANNASHYKNSYIVEILYFCIEKIKDFADYRFSPVLTT